MISSFTKFNESLVDDINKLKNDVDGAFAYISDENNVSIYIRESEVYVDILSILPNNIVYHNIEEYINKHEIWHETLLDINVAIEQLTSKVNVGVVLNINTVGNVKIKFHLIHDNLLLIDNKSITISTDNLTKLLKEEGYDVINIEFYEKYDDDNHQVVKYIKIRFIKNNSKEKEIVDKVVNLFVDNGISKSNIFTNINSDYNNRITLFLSILEPKINTRGLKTNTNKIIKLRKMI